jgi:hypothetical protein
MFPIGRQVEAATGSTIRGTVEAPLTRTARPQTSMAAPLGEIPWPRVRIGRARTRVSAGSRQALATAVRRGAANRQASATVLREAGNKLVVATAVRAGETPGTAVRAQPTGARIAAAEAVETASATAPLQAAAGRVAPVLLGAVPETAPGPVAPAAPPASAEDHAAEVPAAAGAEGNAPERRRNL